MTRDHASGGNADSATDRVAAAIAGEDPELIVALMKGLGRDLLSVGEDAARVLVPDPAIIKNKVSRPTDQASRNAIDEFNPLDDL